MPRRPRLVVPGLPHHITQRGNNRQEVFFTPDDHSLYLHLLKHHARNNETHILGYCLMTNHIHLIAIPGRQNSLARTFGAAHAEYAQELNHSNERSGHLWQSRYFSCPLDDKQVRHAMLYVDLNPARAGLVEDARDWPWSSAQAHSTPGAVDWVLDYDWADQLGGWGHRAWRRRMSTGAAEDDVTSLRRATHSGDPLGSPEFVGALERSSDRRLHTLPRGRPHKPAAEEVTV